LPDLAPRYMGVRPDKGEVGGSSPPRPTILPFKINTFRGF